MKCIWLAASTHKLIYAGYLLLNVQIIKMKISHHSIKIISFFMAYAINHVSWVLLPQLLSLPRLWLHIDSIMLEVFTEAMFFSCALFFAVVEIQIQIEPNGIETIQLSRLVLYYFFCAIVFITIFRASMLDSVLINCKSEK